MTDTGTLMIRDLYMRLHYMILKLIYGMVWVQTE